MLRMELVPIQPKKSFTKTHPYAVPSVFEVGEARSIADAFDLCELVLDQVEVGQVRVMVG